MTSHALADHVLGITEGPGRRPLEARGRLAPSRCPNLSTGTGSRIPPSDDRHTRRHKGRRTGHGASMTAPCDRRPKELSRICIWVGAGASGHQFARLPAPMACRHAGSRGEARVLEEDTKGRLADRTGIRSQCAYAGEYGGQTRAASRRRGF